MKKRLPRNMGMEIVRATESAALSAGRWEGLGKPAEADRFASRAMVKTLKGIDLNGVLVARETHHPENIVADGKKAGAGNGVPVDLLLDPIDGCTQLALGYPGAMSVAAVAPRGTIWAPPPGLYMDKIVVDPQAAPYLVPECLDAPAAWTLALVARAKGVKVKDLTVFLLDRPRHADLIAEIRNAGAHVRLRADGDIAGALVVCTQDSGVDMLMGVGGISEGLLAACAVKAFGGGMLGRLAPQSESERGAIETAGFGMCDVLTADDLVASDQVFFAATGISNGPILSGVIYQGERAKTNSLILRSETQTLRRIFAEHELIEEDGIILAR